MLGLQFTDYEREARRHLSGMLANADSAAGAGAKTAMMMGYRAVNELG